MHPFPGLQFCPLRHGIVSPDPGCLFSKHLREIPRKFYNAHSILRILESKDNPQKYSGIGLFPFLKMSAYFIFYFGSKIRRHRIRRREMTKKKKQALYTSSTWLDCISCCNVVVTCVGQNGKRGGCSTFKRHKMEILPFTFCRFAQHRLCWKSRIHDHQLSIRSTPGRTAK